MTRIGRYQIVGELGRGAMGIVYQATDPAIGRSVAIKTIRISDIQDHVQRKKLRDRLFREARSAGVLSHPNIVTVYDMDEADGLAWIAMAHVKGPTLEKMLGTPQPMPGAQMLRVLRQVAAALDYAHSRGVVHLDIKPANIMSDEDGVIKIADFGIARITGADASETRTVVGTPNYMSPEQIQGHTVDGRSDQFSLGVIAYEMLTGERPFQGEHLSNIVYKIVAADPIPPSRVNGTLGPAIDQVLRRALLRDPGHRFANCSSFVAALEMACGESRGWKPIPAGSAAVLPTIAAPAPLLGAKPQGTVAVPPVKRSHTVFWPVFLGVLLLLGVAGTVAWQAGLVSDSVTGAVTGAVQDAFSNPSTSPGPPPPVTAQIPIQPEPEQDLPVRKPSPLPPLASDTPASASPPATTAATVAVANPSGLQDVFVGTIPPGAKAVLDDHLDQSCQTPCMLHSPAGVHRVTLSLAGYLNDYREIRVGAAAQDIPVIAMRQPGATLMVSSDPSGATIKINGEIQTQATPASIMLKPGTYSVTIEKGGRSQTQKVEIQDNPVFLRIPLGQ